MSRITGWGRGTWDEGLWDSTLPVEVTGVSATTGLGTALQASEYPVSGIAATSALGDESVTGTALVIETGLAGTTALGNENVIIDVTSVVTGLSATGVSGDETVSASALVTETGYWNCVNNANWSEFNRLNRVKCNRIKVCSCWI